MAHDDQNVQRLNLVIHNVDGSAVDVDDRPFGRGFAAVGKIVYCAVTGGGMTAGSYYVCTSLTPDGDLAGGGTWVAVGSGGAFSTWTPVLSQGATTFTTTTNYSRIRINGGQVEGNATVTITAGTGVAGQPVQLSGFAPDAGSGEIGGGYFFSNCADVASGRIDGWAAPGFAGTTRTGFGVHDRLQPFGVLETLDVGDTVVCEFWYPI